LSPLVATPSSPSEQLIVPLSGAVSGGHVGTEGMKQNVILIVSNFTFYYPTKNLQEGLAWETRGQKHA